MAHALDNFAPSVASYTTTGTTSAAPLAGTVNFVANGASNVIHYLPDATKVPPGIPYYVFKTDTGSGTFTIKTAGGTINNVAAGTGVLTNTSATQAFMAISDGTNWWVFKNGVSVLV